MKKKYETPYLLLETFQLNAAVAGSCNDSNSITIGHYENSCGYGTPSEVGPAFEFFNELNCVVDLAGSDGGDDNDTLCYHGPFLAGATFTYS